MRRFRDISIRRKLTVVNVLIHLLLVITLPPLLLGVINKTKAFFGGRVGPPALQLYYDLFKLFRKGSVFSTTTTLEPCITPTRTAAPVRLARLSAWLIDRERSSLRSRYEYPSCSSPGPSWYLSE